MKTYGKSRSTAASPEQVWELWSNPNNWSQWNSGIKSAQVDGPLESGRKGVMTTLSGSKHDVVFENVEPLRGFSMSMDGPPFSKITFFCAIAPAAGGSTISQSVGISGPLGSIFGSMMGPAMAEHFIPVLDDLAAAAEKQLV